MTITELKAHLENLLSEHGDIPVLIDLSAPEMPAYRSPVGAVRLIVSIGTDSKAAVIQDFHRALES